MFWNQVQYKDSPFSELRILPRHTEAMDRQLLIEAS